MGPLGLLSFFAIVGLAPSFLLPAEQAWQAVWWGVAFGAPAAILVLVLSDPQPDYAMKNLLTLSWVIDVAMMVAIILALPVIGGPSFMPGEGPRLAYGRYLRPSMSLPRHGGTPKHRTGQIRGGRCAGGVGQARGRSEVG